MKLVQVNWEPTNRQLRQFGIICLIALPAIGWFWGASSFLLGILSAIGVAAVVVAVLAPQGLKYAFIGLSVCAIPIGIVVGELAMLLIYYAVFLPFGLVFRMARRDALQLAVDRQRTTYWQTKAQPRDVTSYYRQS